MDVFQKFKLIVMSCGMLITGFVNAAPILSIVPSLTTTIVRTDGLAIVSYIVTNNTNQLINNLIITPNFQTTGQANAVTLNSGNTCSGASLVANASCNFSIQILGANQPGAFQVTPRVCGYGGLFCSIPSQNQYLNVSTYAVNTAYAYFSVLSGSNMNTVVPVNTATFQVGTPFLVDQTIQNALAVSPDGMRIYASEVNGDDAAILVLTSGANPQLIQKISLGYFPYLDVIAVTPDGKTIYVGASESSTFYRIDNIAGVYTPTLITLPDGDSASGIVVSPDSSKIFITSYATNAFYVMNASNNTVVQTLTNSGTSCEFDAPGAVVVSSDGNTIYVANGYGSEGISVVQNNGNGTYSCGSRIVSPSEQLAGMVLSPNGSYLYAIGINSPQQLYIVDTSTNTQIASYTIPNGSAGISISPDGSTLFFSNSTACFSYRLPLVNGLPSGEAISINIGGRSETQGNFTG